MWKPIGLLAAFLVLSAPAFGAGAQGNSVYGGIHGGASILMDADNEGEGTSLSIESEADTGFAAGGFIGYKFGNGIRVEGEGTYRRNDLDTLTISNDGGIGAALGVGSLNGLGAEADGDVSAFTFMANAWYEPDVFAGLLPYVGGGIGAAHISADASVSGTKIVDDSDTVFAGQVGAGMGYAVLPNVVLSLDYRFLITADPSFGDEAGGEFDSEYMTHNIMFGVRGHF